MIIFSALFNESQEYFDIYIENFNIFSDANDVLIINVGNFSYEIKDKSLCNRVHIINSKIKRNKWGATLLNGHVENYIFQRDNIKGDDKLFCTLASNALFVRNYDKDSILLELQNSNNNIKSDFLSNLNGWWWHRVKNNKLFCNAFDDKLANSQIEGLLTYAENWEIISKKMPELLEISDGIDEKDIFPFEEIVPATMIASSNKNNLIHVCKIMWERFDLHKQYVGIDEIFTTFKVEKNQLYTNLVENNIFLVKWFIRNNNSLPTYALTNKVIYSSLSNLNKLLLNSNDKKRFSLELIKFISINNLDLIKIDFIRSNNLINFKEALNTEFQLGGGSEAYIVFDKNEYQDLIIDLDINKNLVNLSFKNCSMIENQRVGILYLPLHNPQGNHYLIQWSTCFQKNLIFSKINGSINMDSFEFESELFGCIHVGRQYLSREITYLGIPIYITKEPYQVKFYMF